MMAASARPLPDLVVVSTTQPLRLDELTEGESAIHAALPGNHARRRWRLGRRALRDALTVVGSDADTSKIRFPHRRVSLTYAGDETAAVAAVTEWPDLCGIGIDQEPLATWRPSPSTARFFLTRAEVRWMQRAPERDLPDQLLRLWTVKEALFKADQGNAEARLVDYQLDDPGADCGTAEVAGDRTSFWYRSQVTPRGMVRTVAVAQR
jgi:hypothetical protein